MNYVGCTNSCQNSSCLNECGRVLNGCLNDCPCNTNCPDGCNGCSNPICVCGENPSPQNKDNLKQCIKKKSIDLGQCIIDCKDDQSCEQSCVDLFKVQYDECPCQVGMLKRSPISNGLTLSDWFKGCFKVDCPLGCPCDSFDCQPEKKSVLVLNNTFRSNKPLLIKFEGNLDSKCFFINDCNGSGGVDENLDFTMGPDTTVQFSCSAELNGELFIFGGGGSEDKQVIFFDHINSRYS